MSQPVVTVLGQEYKLGLPAARTQLMDIVLFAHNSPARAKVIALVVCIIAGGGRLRRRDGAVATGADGKPLTVPSLRDCGWSAGEWSEACLQATLDAGWSVADWGPAGAVALEHVTLNAPGVLSQEALDDAANFSNPSQAASSDSGTA